MIPTSVVLVTLTVSVFTNDNPQQQDDQPRPTAAVVIQHSEETRKPGPTTPAAVVQHSEETRKPRPTTPASESASPPRTKSKNRHRGLGLFAVAFKLLNPTEWLAVSAPPAKPKPSEPSEQ